MSESRKTGDETVYLKEKSRNLKKATLPLPVGAEPKKDNSLETDAINEILKDTKRGSVRSEISGAYGWKGAPKINPRLFGNTLIQVLQTNRRKANAGIAKKNNRNTLYQRTSITKDKVTRPIEIKTASKRYQSSSVTKRSKNVSNECTNSNHQKDDIIPVNEGNGE